MGRFIFLYSDFKFQYYTNKDSLERYNGHNKEIDNFLTMLHYLTICVVISSSSEVNETVKIVNTLK